MRPPRKPPRSPALHEMSLSAPHKLHMPPRLLLEVATMPLLRVTLPKPQTRPSRAPLIRGVRVILRTTWIVTVLYVYFHTSAETKAFGYRRPSFFSKKKKKVLIFGYSLSPRGQMSTSYAPMPENTGLTSDMAPVPHLRRHLQSSVKACRIPGSGSWSSSTPALMLQRKLRRMPRARSRSCNPTRYF